MSLLSRLGGELAELIDAQHLLYPWDPFPWRVDSAVPLRSLVEDLRTRRCLVNLEMGVTLPTWGHANRKNRRNVLQRKALWSEPLFSVEISVQKFALRSVTIMCRTAMPKDFDSDTGQV